MKTKLNVGRCHIEVQGMNFRCPLCGTLVQSGQTHDCELKAIPEKPEKKNRKGAR